MNVTVGEIASFSLMFILPSAMVMLLGYVMFTIISLRKKRGFPKLLHWVDLVIPFLATALWCKVQTCSIYTKSMGNLAELGILGLIWGLAFLYRGILVIRKRDTRIWHFLLLECAVTFLLAIFAPTFPE